MVFEKKTEKRTTTNKKKQYYWTIKERNYNTGYITKKDNLIGFYVGYRELNKNIKLDILTVIIINHRWNKIIFTDLICLYYS